MGARENQGGKGRAWVSVAAGASLPLAVVQGSGTVDRIWMTLRERTPQMLRSLRIEMTWDGAAKPAVSVPLGDFFGACLGEMRPFDSALFSSPEGRSFNCYIPMPFRKSARIEVVNDGKEDLSMLFYDIDVTLRDDLPKDAGYLHAYWNRTPRVPLGQDYEILPRTEGKGRLLAVNVGVLGDPLYAGSGWCEGEIRMFVDGDRDRPTLAGTGTEDYMGTGWGAATYSHRYHGSLIADDETSRWAFYRQHVPDPVFFENDLRVTLQDMGGDETANVRKMLARGAQLQPVTVAHAGGFTKLIEETGFPTIEDPSFPDGWVNFYRSDDFSSIAYFYLDRPSSNLPALPSVLVRTASLRKEP